MPTNGLSKTFPGHCNFTTCLSCNSMTTLHAVSPTRTTLLQSRPSNDRRPDTIQLPVASPPGLTVSDTRLTDSEFSTQSDSLTAWTQSKYFTTATSSYESQVLTTADVHGFRHSDHDSRPFIPETDVKHGLMLTSHDNQEQQALDTVDPSNLVSWLVPEPDLLPLPAPKPYSKVTGELGVFLGKEDSKTSSSQTEQSQTVGLKDGVPGSTSLFRQHESHPAHPSISIAIATLVQTSTNGGTSTSTITTSTQRMHGPAISRINWSTPISKQGVELILMSVVGGSLAFIAIVLLHRLVFRSFRRKNQQSDHLNSLSLANNSSREGSDTCISDAVEVSHFSIES